MAQHNTHKTRVWHEFLIFFNHIKVFYNVARVTGYLFIYILIILKYWVGFSFYFNHKYRYVFMKNIFFSKSLCIFNVNNVNIKIYVDATYILYKSLYVFNVNIFFLQYKYINISAQLQFTVILLSVMYIDTYVLTVIKCIFGGIHEYRK